MALQASPQLQVDPNQTALYDKNSFLFRRIEKSPAYALSYCEGMLEKFRASDESSTFVDRMKMFQKERCMQLVWASDKFKDKPVEENITKQHLSSKYDEMMLQSNLLNKEDRDRFLDKIAGTMKPHTDAEKDRYTKDQLEQHLLALCFVINKAQAGDDLTEDFIQQTHQILMNGLTADGEEIPAGIYRQCSVSANGHTYPLYTCIPAEVPEIVRQHNESKGSDKYERASKLLSRILCLHPFRDGNGRVARLLWNFSLISDGVPFPIMPFPSTRKPYKDYITCITKDRELLHGRYMSGMTLISVMTVWNNFVLNLQFEAKDLYKDISAWLKDIEH
uniref:Fido domain-containing protein n=1 Tax=Amphimedon queenslandica TaxID=400682 RepID=A0A1X7VAR7_AMPQE